MPPRLVLCHCDPDWTALAVCETCERRELHALLLRRGQVQDRHIDEAFAALAASYRLDAGDETDREYARAQDRMDTRP